ncbi:hypothetical protein ACIBI8_00440 [Streptomyces sp. NPDC050529]|uniref:hypothetical protein n=1 Tax=Streptomyces sp. NPDC050529 TaxID=3365624 RepID=UPI0037A4198B
MDTPLDGVTFSKISDLQLWMRKFVTQETNRMLSGRFSCDPALMTSLRRIYSHLAEAVNSQNGIGNFDAIHVMNWVRSKIKYMQGGAPWPRQRELLALSKAGVVTFLGAGGRVCTDLNRGTTCSSDTVPGIAVPISHLIDARNANHSVRLSGDTLRRELYQRGEIIGFSGAESLDARRATATEVVRVNDTCQLVHANGEVSTNRFAVGLGTTHHITTPGVPIAHANSDFLLLTDRVARTVLKSLSHH